MKSILKAFAVTAALVGMSGSVAFADTTCSGSISNTGPGSTNSVNCVDNNNNQVTCNNNVVISSTNSQSSNSGSANNSGNTTSGGASSGDSSNSNSTVVNVGASCTPVAGGQGGDFTVTSSPPQVLSDQVAVKPAGGAGAGAGAGVATDKTAATFGILGSAGLIGLGVVLRKRALNG